MDDKKVFSPQVLDETGKRRERFNAIYRITHVQKKQLAAEIMDIGLAELEKRVKAASKMRAANA